MEENRGRGVGNHPGVVLVSVIASLIGIVVFVTGKQQLSDFFTAKWGESRSELRQPQGTPRQSESASSGVEPVAHKSRESQLGADTPTESIVVSLDSSRAKDIWTTNVYSYAPGGGGGGGGLDNDELRVGGWGDLYHSLIQFDLQGLPPNVASAKLQLYAMPHSGSVGATPIFVDRVTQPWDWPSTGSGTDHERLWWQDRPSALQVGDGFLPAPEPNDWYSIDITEVYNAWQRGDFPNYGLQLRPVRNDNQWATFVSSNEESRTSRRPRLVLEVESGK